MSHFKLFLLISLVLGSCSRTYNVTTDSMSNTFNAGQVIKAKNKPSVNRGDIVFFRRNFNSGQGKQTWLFRVVAFSGDTIEIKDGGVIVNNKIIGLPEKARLMYILTTSKSLELKSFRENTVRQMAENKYIAYLTVDEFNKVSKWPEVTTISRIISSAGKHANGIVRNDLTDSWNEDQFGPLYIPKTGEKIKIDQANRDLYSDILSDLQTDSTILIKERLFFLMGDNRSNASDSRFIGLVTESNITGYADENP
jgi:signal peptidase I